jgi:hypothetical protein
MNGQKMWYVYTKEYYSAMTKNSLVIHRKMDNHHVKQNKPDLERQIPCFLSQVEYRLKRQERGNTKNHTPLT